MIICDDCKKATYKPTHFVLGVVRCPYCTNVFSSAFRELQQNILPKEHSEDETCDQEKCQACCDHEYDSSEGMMCLNCDAEYPY